MGSGLARQLVSTALTLPPKLDVSGVREDIRRLWPSRHDPEVREDIRLYIGMLRVAAVYDGDPLSPFTYHDTPRRSHGPLD